MSLSFIFINADDNDDDNDNIQRVAGHCLVIIFYLHAGYNGDDENINVIQVLSYSSYESDLCNNYDPN